MPFLVSALLARRRRGLAARRAPDATCCLHFLGASLGILDALWTHGHRRLTAPRSPLLFGLAGVSRRTATTRQQVPETGDQQVLNRYRNRWRQVRNTYGVPNLE